MIKINSKVKFIDRNLKGVVVELLKNDNYLINTEDNFLEEVNKNEIIEYNDIENLKLENSKIKIKDKKVTKKIDNKFTNKNQNIKIPFIDLHLNDKNLLSIDNFLSHQLKECEDFINKYIGTKHKEILIIHGIGEGILKKNVLLLLKEYNLEIAPEGYNKYGEGSTIVFLN